MAHLCLESCFENVSHIEGDKLMMNMIFLFHKKKISSCSKTFVWLWVCKAVQEVFLYKEIS